MASRGETMQGVLPALMTPFTSDNEVNVPMVRRLVEHQMQQGCHGFFVCGSTGEGLYMTADERKLVAQTVIETVAGEVPVMIHVGCVGTDASVDLAKHARKCGADAVSSLPPIYYRVGLQGMISHVAAIAAAAELPTYYYHIPQLTGLELSGDEIVDAFTSVDGVVGLKYTGFDMFLMWWMVSGSEGRLRVFNGADQMLFDGLCAGAIGGIGSTYNYQTRTVVQIFETLQSGDHARARMLQDQANKVIRVLFRNGGNLACEKAIMRLLGFDVGLPRRPMVPFPEDRMELLQRQLEQVHFFD